MMKKKPFNIQKWLWIAGVPTTFGVILLFARTLIAYADMPKRVETIEKYVEQQQRANEIQAKANELMQEQLKQQPQQPYCEVYQEATWCWDEKSQTWYQVKEAQ